MKRLIAITFLLLTQTNYLFSQGNPLELKMEYLGHILVHVKINDKYDANLILDSGADEVLLDEEYFRNEGIEITRSQRAQLPGAGGEAKTITVVLDRMEIGLDTITYVPRYVPLMDLRSIVGEKADGVIGISFLRGYLAEIDFDGEKLILHNKINLEQFEKINLEVINNRYYFPVSINVDNQHIIKGKFQLDLGNGGTLVINSPFANKYQLAKTINNKMKYYNVSGGAGGRVEGYKFRARSVQIGNIEVKSPCVDWATDSAGALAREDYDGLFGNQILERFRTIVDFTNGVLYLKPKANLNHHFISTATGFSYSNKNRTKDFILVTGLYENGNAEKAGIQEGDQIVAIQGIPVTSMRDKQIESWLKNPGKAITVQLRRNADEMKITLSRDEPF